MLAELSQSSQSLTAYRELLHDGLASRWKSCMREQVTPEAILMIILSNNSFKSPALMREHRSFSSKY